MLQVKSSLNLDAIETSLRHAAQKRGASVVSVMRLSHLIRDKETGPSKDAMVLFLCHPELSTALLAGDLRFAAALPCRIAAYEEGGSVTLAAQPPSEFAKALGRPDMETLLLLVDATLKEIMDEASRPAAAVAAAGMSARRRNRSTCAVRFPSGSTARGRRSRNSPERESTTPPADRAASVTRHPFHTQCLPLIPYTCVATLQRRYLCPKRSARGD